MAHDSEGGGNTLVSHAAADNDAAVATTVGGANHESNNGTLLLPSTSRVRERDSSNGNADEGKAVKIGIYGLVNAMMAIPILYGYAAIIFRCVCAPGWRRGRWRHMKSSKVPIRYKCGRVELICAGHDIPIRYVCGHVALWAMVIFDIYPGIALFSTQRSLLSIRYIIHPPRRGQPLVSISISAERRYEVSCGCRIPT